MPRAAKVIQDSKDFAQIPSHLAEVVLQLRQAAGLRRLRTAEYGVHAAFTDYPTIQD